VYDGAPILVDVASNGAVRPSRGIADDRYSIPNFEEFLVVTCMPLRADHPDVQAGVSKRKRFEPHALVPRDGLVLDNQEHARTIRLDRGHPCPMLTVNPSIFD
jgi:hypothetical protein